MATVAIYSADPAWRRRLERLLAETGITVAASLDDARTLARTIEQTRLDAVVADAPSPEQLAEWCDLSRRAAVVVMVADLNASEALDALAAGARAVVNRSAGAGEIAAAVVAASRGLATLPRDLLDALLDLR